MVTLQWASVEHGKNCRAVEGRKTHRDARRNRRAGAPKRATTHYLLLPTLYFLLAPFVVHLHLRRRAAESPCGRAQARQPRTTFFSLLSTLYEKIFVSIRVHSWFKIVFRAFRGSNMFFVCFVCFVVSLLPHRATRGGIAVRARPSAPTTHYFLLPTLSSLLMPVLYPVYTLPQKTMHHRA